MRELVRRIALCGAAVGLLAAADAGIAVAAANGEGNAKGRTSQGRVVRLKVKGKKLQMRHFTAELRCRDGSELVVQESGFVPTKVSGGSFSDKQFGSTDTVRFKGTVGKKAVKGKIRVKDRWGKVRCNSRWISFSARFRG